MHNRPVNRGVAATGSLAAALAMAVLVGVVFFLLQDYGPESALRKFHQAIVSHDLAGLRRVVMAEANEDDLNRLAAMVEGLARSGARYRLRQVSREDRRVVAMVEYVLPNRLMQPTFFWVIQKSGGRWRVDVESTMDLRRQMLQRQLFGS